MNKYHPHENCPEVGSAAYMPGVYKTPMVRMPEMADEYRECTGLKVEHAEMCVCVKSQAVRKNKNASYEIP